MLERITPVEHNNHEVVIQHEKDHMQVGLGLEPRGDVPSQHFIDAIYGGVPSQTKIGTIFRERLLQDRGVNIHEGYAKANAQHILDDEIGRMILDAVTGSTTSDGLWTWLDRAGVNRLIRLLRKARDNAFGRDE